MQMFLILFKLVLICFIIAIFFNVIGKKHITEINVINFILLLLLSNIVINSKSFLESAIVILFLIIFKVIVKYVTPILPTIKYLIFNRESLIIKKGKINFKEMMKRQYKINDLLSELKNKNIKRIEDVDYALLNYNNTLNISCDKDIPIPIIWNGRIDNLSLRMIHKNTSWINKIIEKENIALDNIFYAFYKQKRVYIIQNK